MTVITTDKELVKAVNEEQDTIVIEGDLAKKTIRIKATGKVAWAVAILATGIVVYSIIVTAGSVGVKAPSTGLFAAVSGGIAVAKIGSSTTVVAIFVAIASGVIALLTKLRRYRIIEKYESCVILKKIK